MHKNLTLINMKKVIFGAALLGGLVFTACKKDHTCSCTTTATGTFEFTITADTVLTDMKKSDAESTCTGFNESASSGGESYSTTCELK